MILTRQPQVIKQRLQADSGNPVSMYNGPIHCARLAIKREGLKGLFTGITLALPYTAMWNFVFYFFFSLLRPIWDRHNNKNKVFFTMLRSILHGISAGVMTQLVMLPLDCVNLRRTVAYERGPDEEKGNTRAEGNVYLNIVQEVYEEGGITAFWKGLVPGLCLTINPGIVQLIRKFMTDKIVSQRSGGATTTYENFQIGLVAKLVASSITYPLVVSKVLMSVKKKNEKDLSNSFSRNTGLTELGNVLKSIVRTSGTKGLYKGIRPHLTQVALKAGILNAVRLKILDFVIHVLGNGK